MALHAMAFVAFMEAPGFELPRASESEYKQVIAGKEEKIVWYKFRKELPRVTPPAAKPDKRHCAPTALRSGRSSPRRKKPQTRPDGVGSYPSGNGAATGRIAERAGDQAAPQRFVAPPDIVKPAIAKVDVPTHRS